MDFKEILEMMPLLLSLLVSFIGLICSIVKLIKGKKWDNIKVALCEFMIQAEEMATSGEDKKNIVLKLAEEFCKKQGYKFDANQVSSCIETLIDFSKKVNNREKDKTSG